MLVALSEQDIVRAAQSGDRTALDQLTRRLYKPVLSLAGRLLRPGDAQEIAQETFARVVKHLGEFDPDRKFAAWVFTIAANLCRDRHRRSRKTRPIEESTVSIDLPPESNAIRMENRDRVNRAVDRLPFDMKVVVVMHFQQDLPLPEIAEALDVSVNTVRIRLYRALKALRGEVKE